MKKIIVPFINNNETEAKLVAWNVKDKSNVNKGDIIASIETTKADVDLESEFEGKIKIIGKPGNDYAFGEVIAIIYNDESDIKDFDIEHQDSNKERKPMITKPARNFMKSHNILEEDVLNLGLEIIKTKDIKHLIKNKEE